MDTGVMTNIATYQTATTKASDPLENSTGFIDQLSPPSFWDNIDNSASSSLLDSPRLTVDSQSHSAITSLSSSDSAQETSAKPPKDEKTPKRPSAKKRKCSDTKQRDLSALDCSDYWLRFDSDNESLYHAGGDHNAQDKSDQARLFDWIQPYSRASSVATTGTFNLAFQSPSDNSIDDSALEHALSDEEDLFSMALADGMKTESPTSGIEAPERLYSTPLSWERPQLGVEIESYLPSNTSYNDPDRQRLLAIALGSGFEEAPSQVDSNQPTEMDFRFDMNESPNSMSDRRSDEPEQKRVPPKPRGVPARTSSGGIGGQSREKPKSSDRAAHNDIERKYRTNLKDRIAELRDAIPSLRAIPDDGDDMASARAAPKVSKVGDSYQGVYLLELGTNNFQGTVLSKATEYIHQLERRNRSMAQKNEDLARRLQAFEQLIGTGMVGTNWQPQGFGAAVFNPRPFP